jgi:hypothetical protein
MVGLDGGGACLAIAEISSSLDLLRLVRFPWGNDFGRAWAGMSLAWSLVIFAVFSLLPYIGADFWRASGKSKSGSPDIKRTDRAGRKNGPTQRRGQSIIHEMVPVRGQIRTEAVTDVQDAGAALPERHGDRARASRRTIDLGAAIA